MHQPFIYKYQPKTLEESNLPEALRMVIETFLATGKLSLLFVGPGGSGKTTLLTTILSHYYEDAEPVDNVLAINPLHDQGIAYCRSDLKTFCQTSCTIKGKKKTVLLDDLDIVNEQSQQVFRHCIDRYKNKVNFVASCSNTQKVVDSLQSRFTMLKLESMSDERIRSQMNRVAEEESISISGEAADLVAMLSSGSMRTLLNYMEKFKLLDTEITRKVAMQVCTNISFDELAAYTNMCRSPEQIAEALQLMNAIYHRGYSVMDILDTYFHYVKCTPLLSEDEKYRIIPLICKYIAVFNTVHEDQVELAFFTRGMSAVFSGNNIDDFPDIQDPCPS